MRRYVALIQSIGIQLDVLGFEMMLEALETIVFEASCSSSIINYWMSESWDIIILNNVRIEKGFTISMMKIIADNVTKAIVISSHYKLNPEILNTFAWHKFWWRFRNHIAHIPFWSFHILPRLIFNGIRFRRAFYDSPFMLFSSLFGGFSFWKHFAWWE
jgi:hypothetical protein